MENDDNSPSWVSSDRSSMQRDSGARQDNADPDKNPTEDEAHDPRWETEFSFAERNNKAYADALTKAGYIPVLLFGDPNSGKSTLLLSLLAYAQTNAKLISVRLGDPIFTLENDESKDSYQHAKRFYEEDVPKFRNGNTPLTTNLPHPIFIPIEIRSSNTSNIVKLALLEIDGSKYQRKSDYRFPAPINSILQHYGHGVLILYLAPLESRDEYGRSSIQSNTMNSSKHEENLRTAIETYAKVRTNKSLDHHLFLLTCWDNQVKDDLKEIANPSPSFVEKCILEHFEFAWNTFISLRKIHKVASSYYMQYVAAKIKTVDNTPEVTKPPQNEIFIYDHYPRTLLNWMFFCATSKDGENGEFIFSDTISIKQRILAKLNDFFQFFRLDKNNL